MSDPEPIDSPRSPETAASETATVLAANLRVLRELRGLSQLDLADRVGLSRRTIARLEASDVADPGVDQVRNLAQVLGVSVPLLIESRLTTITIPVPIDRLERIDARALDRMLRALD
jgi:transcriptional regulator with XRE-family HTH domain